MSPNERLLRKSLRRLRDAINAYGDNKMWGDPDEDLDDDGVSKCGLRVERALSDAKATLAATNGRAQKGTG
jgi:hypothetical protein